MDPNAAWAMLNDPLLPVGERIEAGHALADWLEGGGFMPDAAAFRGYMTRRDAIIRVQRQIAYWEAH